MKRCLAVQAECSKQKLMFASDIKDDNEGTSAVKLSAAGRARVAVPTGTIGCQPRKPSIALPHCDDERELEYGCVDWFLYDKQRAEGTGRAQAGKAPVAAGNAIEAASS